MKDTIAKQKGLPYSTSRGQELANKRNTKKARRQDGARQISQEEREFNRQFEEWRGDSDGGVGCD